MKDDFDTNQQQMNPSDMSTDTAMHSGQQNQFSGMPQQSGMMSGPQSGMPGSYNQPTQPQGGGLVGGQQAQHQQQVTISLSSSVWRTLTYNSYLASQGGCGRKLEFCFEGTGNDERA